MLKICFDVIKILGAWFIGLFYRKRYKNVWLIAERGVDARDNGYSFFLYLNNLNTVNCFYAITKDSADFCKVKATGNWVEQDSFKHGVIFFSCDAIISTHTSLAAPRWRGIWKIIALFHLNPKGKKIFLQHGITKDTLPVLQYPQFKTDLFVCGAKPEYDFIKNTFGHPDGVVQYTGFPRYDYLNEYNRQKVVLLMPTWRMQYTNYSVEQFIHSDFYKQYSLLLNSEELNLILLKKGWKLVFYPHYEIQKWINLFKSRFSTIEIASFEKFDVQELLRTCGVLITDYSSVFFDIAYCKKPIIYYQFDYAEYRSSHYGEGYFNYNDAFGPVVTNLGDLLVVLNDFNFETMQQKYKNKVDEYFLYHDTNNCDRVYKCILNMINRN